MQPGAIRACLLHAQAAVSAPNGDPGCGAQRVLRRVLDILTAIATVVTIFTAFSGWIASALEAWAGPAWSLQAAAWLAEYGWSILLGAVGVLLFSAAFAVYRLRASRRKIAAYQLAFVQEYAQFSRETADHRASAASAAPPDERLLATHLYQFLRTSLGHVAATLSAYTGRECHASIKSYREDTENIKTEARNANHLDRDKADEVLTAGFHYKDSTAFSDILDNSASHYFVANNLRRLARRQRYTNKNPDWRTSYNATVIVPITLRKAAASVDPSTVIGFLCVDNFGGGFDRKACVDILAMFARHYYIAMVENVRVIQESRNLAESRPE